MRESVREEDSGVVFQEEPLPPLLPPPLLLLLPSHEGRRKVGRGIPPSSRSSSKGKEKSFFFLMSRLLEGKRPRFHVSFLHGGFAYLLGRKLPWTCVHGGGGGWGLPNINGRARYPPSSLRMHKDNSLSLRAWFHGLVSSAFLGRHNCKNDEKT